MAKVGVIQILVSQAAIIGIGFLWFNFNKTVSYLIRDLIEKAFNPVDPDEGFEKEDE